MTLHNSPQLGHIKYGPLKFYDFNFKYLHAWVYKATSYARNARNV
jgi:hypothetical protein